MTKSLPIRWIVPAFMLAGAALYLTYQWWTPSSEEAVSAARRALEQGEYERAEQLARDVLDRSPRHSYPLPDWNTTEAGAHAYTGFAGEGMPHDPELGAQFVDQARDAGLDFTYVYGGDPATPGMRMFEFAGGGVAVLDYDQDCYCDLYLAQGCDWPPDPRQQKHLDRLFRNMGDGKFQDVTADAGLGDQGYSQGVAVGDFNNDGFPDLYLANIGQNRLYRNNGDGTFADVSAESGLSRTGWATNWTTSCLLADLNGDALPDLYDVNYLEGEDLYERMCEVEGEWRACSPEVFSAQQDRLWLNLGDGRFEDCSAAAGILAPEGKGLALVAADFNGSGLLSLFIANDKTPNFYFQNQTSPRGGSPSFVENGILSGLAFDRDGRALSCMGVACGDANGDGLCDLFVTNFYREASTLYQQLAPNLFTDATREAGLREPSFLTLGFGTQFLDAELDGLPDLIVTNGHIDDFTFQGIPFRMPAQFYRNAGAGKFTELERESLGPYFQGDYLGRSLVRLDWNRDGREDCIIGHLDAPLALLTNQTAPAGDFLAVELRGVATDRDAIGTNISVTVAGRTYVRQLTAGDGYLASNERKLIFGLAAAERVEQLSVRWTSGREQTFHDLRADQELLLIEGHAPVSRPHP